jgi:hypothetical protein
MDFIYHREGKESNWKKLEVGKRIVLRLEVFLDSGLCGNGKGEELEEKRLNR